MKTRSLLFSRVFAVCFVWIASVSMTFAFEGKVEMKMTDVKNKSESLLTYHIKGTKMRYEMKPDSNKKKKEEGSFVGIFNYDTKEMIMLIPGDQKMYMVMKIDPADAAAVMTKKGDTDFKPTGRKEKIVGIEAEEYTGVSYGKWTEVWVTKEMGAFMAAQGKGKKKMEGWEKFMRDNNAFPLRMIQRGKEGGPEEFRTDVVNVDKSAQPDSLFVPPPGYQKMPSMGDIMKGAIPKL